MNRHYRSLLWQWARQLWRRPTPVQIDTWPQVAPSQVAITRGGHATMVVRYHNLTVLTDPLLTRFCKGVARAEASGISRDALSHVDLVLISDIASDHLHRPSLARLPKSATIVMPRGAAREIGGLDFDRVLELRPGQDFTHRGVDITTAAGEPDSLVYLLRGDGPSVFYCGSSGMTDVFATIGESHQPDVALLPIGGYSPKSFRRRHLTPETALDAFEALRARVFIPHRYGAFALSYETLDDPERWLAQEVSKRDLERYVEVLNTGETQLLIPPRGRAQTEHGGIRRPIGREDNGDSIEDDGYSDGISNGHGSGGIGTDSSDEDDPDHFEDCEPSVDIDIDEAELDGDGSSPDESLQRP